MIEVLLLAIALSMDAFAVSIGLGSKQTQNPKPLAWLAGLYFGLFQGLMPLIGYLGGRSVALWVDSYAGWISFGLLTLIGGKMIYESFQKGIEEEIKQITHKVMLLLAVATSIDAMAAGFALTQLQLNAFLACFIIAITTFLFSYLGVYVGVKSGTKLESKAELLGGVILVLIGLKIAFF